MNENLIHKIIKKINNSPHWEHEGEVRFPSDDVNDFVVDQENLHMVSDVLSQQNFNHSLTGGRHGSLLTVSDKSRWTLELIANILNRRGPNKIVTPPKVIDLLIGLLFNELIFPDSFVGIAQKDKDRTSEVINLIMGTRELMIPFLVDHNPSKSFKEGFEELAHREERQSLSDEFKIEEVFLPTITFHPIRLIRNIFLAVLRPEYLIEKEKTGIASLGITNKVEFDEFSLIPNFNSISEIHNLDINFYELADNAIKRMNSFLNDEEKAEYDDYVNNITSEKKYGKYKYFNLPKESIEKISSLRKGASRKGSKQVVFENTSNNVNLSLFDQIKEKDLDEITDKFILLKKLSAKAGVIQSYRMTNLSSVKKKEDRANIKEGGKQDDFSKNKKILDTVRKEIINVDLLSERLKNIEWDLRKEDN